MATKRICSVDGCGKAAKAGGMCPSHYKRTKLYGNPLGGSTRKGELMEFVATVVLNHNGDGCLKWPYGNKGNGVGVIYVSGKKTNVNRYICSIVHGDPPTPSHQVAHSCGKGGDGCCAPNHLSWKTQSENEKDKLIHGTHNRGERHPLSKLTEIEVREILSVGEEYSHSYISRRYGVSVGTISDIRRRRNWKWLQI